MLRAVTFDFWSTLFVDTRGRERERLRGDVLDEALRSEGHTVSDADLTMGLSAAWDHFEVVWLNEHRYAAGRRAGRRHPGRAARTPGR